MGGLIAWMAAQAEEAEVPQPENFCESSEEEHRAAVSEDERVLIEQLPAHQFPGTHAGSADAAAVEGDGWLPDEGRWNPARRTYRKRTTDMLRKYLKYSIETGRMPSLLGAEFFRAKVTAYRVVTFEDRVIFVHDMEKCLGMLEEFSRQIIAKYVLEEHDQAETARRLGCNERTVRRAIPAALDEMTEILLAMGLLKPLNENSKKSCQGGKAGPFSVSDCEDGENKL